MMQKLVLIAPLVARAVLYVLIGLSVLSIGVIIERWWYFRRRRDDIGGALRRVRKALARGDLAAARKALAASKSIEAEIVGEAMDWYADGPDAVEQILAKAMRAAAEEASRRACCSWARWATTRRSSASSARCSASSTAFRELGGNQMGAAMGNVMGGIAEALLATAVGILVALPAVIFYNVFQKKGADIEEGAAAIGNVVLASMQRAPEAERHRAAAKQQRRRRRTPAVEPAGRPSRWRPRPWPGRCRRGGPRPTIAAINVTPLVDVVLVLAGHPDGRVDVHRGADAEGAAAAREVDRRHRGEADEDRAPQGRASALERGAGRRERRLAEKMKAAVAADPEMSLVVSADKEVMHGNVVHVLDLAKLAGITKFAINVQQTE